jgi:hypothetical protein
MRREVLGRSPVRAKVEARVERMGSGVSGHAAIFGMDGHLKQLPDELTCGGKALWWNAIRQEIAGAITGLPIQPIYSRA